MNIKEFFEEQKRSMDEFNKEIACDECGVLKHNQFVIKNKDGKTLCPLCYHKPTKTYGVNM